MSSTDQQQRLAKWAGREAEWLRLAKEATDSHISDVCSSMAAQAAMMAAFMANK